MALTKIKGLQMWCQRTAGGYRDVDVRDMTASWKSGLAFCAIIHRFRPDLIDYDSLSKENILENNQLAFEVAEKELDIPALLEAADMVAMRVPDKLSVITYVSQYYNYFRDKPQLGGPGVKSPLARGSLPKKRPQESEPTSVPETKHFMPAKDSNVGTIKKTPNKYEAPKKQNTMGDKCDICQNKVYLLERHIENGKLYHRSCFRHSDLSPTTKVFKNSPYFSPDSKSDGPASQPKVRKTGNNDSSWTKSTSEPQKSVVPSDNKPTQNSHNTKSNLQKALFSDNQSDVAINKTPAKQDPLLARFHNVNQEKHDDVPKYKKTRPLILQVDTTTSSNKDDKIIEHSPSALKFGAKKFEKHEHGFVPGNKDVSERSKLFESNNKTSLGIRTEQEKSKSSESGNTKVSAFPVPRPRHLINETEKKNKVERMDTTETVPPKPSVVNPVPSVVSPVPTPRTSVLDMAKAKKPVQGRPKTPPPFGKKKIGSAAPILRSHDDSASSPDSPPPPLPSSRPPTFPATDVSSSDKATPIPVSLPPAFPKKSSQTEVVLSTSSSAVPQAKLRTNRQLSVVKTSNAITDVPVKPLHSSVAEPRTESPMDIDKDLNKAQNPQPGSEPVAVLLSPVDQQEDKHVLSGLLKSLANVRQTTEEPKQSVNVPDRKVTDFGKVAKIKHQEEISLTKDKKTKDNEAKSSASSFVSEKMNFFKGDQKKEVMSSDPQVKVVHNKVKIEKKTTTTKITSETNEKKSKPKSVNLLQDSKKSEIGTQKTKKEDSDPSWKKDLKSTGLRSKSNSLENLLQDSKVNLGKEKRDKVEDNIPSWKKELDKNKTDKSKSKGSALVQDNRLVSGKPNLDDSIPSWKTNLEINVREKTQTQSSGLVPDSKPVSKSKIASKEDHRPAWMKALDDRKAEKSRPKSVDVLSLEESVSDKHGKNVAANWRDPATEIEHDPALKPTKKERPKSTGILLQDTEKSSNLPWQIEAQRRMAANKESFVDPEKVKVSETEVNEGKKPERPKTPVDLLERKLGPKNHVVRTNGDNAENEAAPKVKKRVPVQPPERPPSPPRQLKKISIDTKFDFQPRAWSKLTTDDKKSSVSTVTSPVANKPPPHRPPPPSPKTDISPQRVSPHDIQHQLSDIDSKLTELELRGRQLEDSIRNVSTTEEEDDMMIEWFKLINAKNELVRKEADLIYINKEQDLETEQEDVDVLLRRLMNKPDELKTDEERQRETDLLNKKLMIVNQRSNIIDSMDEDKHRYEEEDRDIAAMLEDRVQRNLERRCRDKPSPSPSWISRFLGMLRALICPQWL